ncbi:MAG TPA: MFS transporter [Pedococcus sp.]|nr:MFS transporter [Pedococcus sp.]
MTGPGEPSRRGDVRLLLTARVAAASATALTLFALTIHAHDSGGGTGRVAAIMVAFALPSVIGMGAAGHLADQHDSRTVLVLSGCAQVCAVGALTLGGAPWVIYALVVVAQLAQTIGNPTWSALLPMITGDNDYGRVVATQQGAVALAGIVAAGVGGLVAATWGTGAVLWAATASCAVLTACGAMVKARRGGSSPSPGSVWSGLGRSMFSPAGVRLLRDDAVVWPLLTSLLAALLLLESVNVAEVFLIRDTLHGSASAFGVVQALSGAGAVGGAWAAGRVRTQRARLRTVGAAMAASGACMAGAGAAPNTAIAGIAFALIGFAIALANGTFFPALMLRTHDSRRGAVNAAAMGLGRAATMAGLAVGAGVGALVGPRTMFLVAGALIAATCCLVVVRVWRATRQLRDNPTLPEPDPASQRPPADL